MPQKRLFAPRHTIRCKFRYFFTFYKVFVYLCLYINDCFFVHYGKNFKKIGKRRKMNYKVEIIIKGHILNPFWKSRLERRHRRGEVIRKAVCHALEPYNEFIRELRPNQMEGSHDFPGNDVENSGNPKGMGEKERIFSIWLQGEENAPEIAKACWKSARKNCPEPLVILDEKSIPEWIELPEHIIRKRKEGKIGHAHYTDICRLALLVKYGGLWLDATDYIPAPLPAELWKRGFFVYTSGEVITGSYADIQNCFIRAKKGNFLAKAWLELIYEYWRREDRAMDYFIHQLLFMMLVENNEAAAEEFRKMPKIDNDAAHELWFVHRDEPYSPELWKEVTRKAIFQKTEYRSGSANSPAPGTMAWHLIKSSH